MEILHGKEGANQQAGSKEALRGRSGESREERERGGLVSEFNRMSVGEVTVRFLSNCPENYKAGAMSRGNSTTLFRHLAREDEKGEC